MVGGAFIDLALTFPQESRLLIGRPYLRWLGFPFGAFLSLYSFLFLFNFSQPTAYIPTWQSLYLFDAVAGLVFLGFNWYYAIYAPSPVVKSQARTVLFGSIIAFLPIIVWQLLSPFGFSFVPSLFIPIVLFPITIGYTILRFRFLHVEDWVRLGAVYAVLSFVIIGGYAGLVTGLSMIFSNQFLLTRPIWVGLGIFVLTVLVDPIRGRLQSFIDQRFFRGSRAYADRVQIFGRELSAATDLNAIGRVLRQQVVSSLAPDRVHIYTFDALNDQYQALPGENSPRATSDIRFTSSSPLVRHFTSEKIPLYLDGVSALPEDLLPEQSRLTLLDSRLLIALPGKRIPIGWLALGGRRSGQPYTPRDLSFLESLCEQAAGAIERLQTVANLERRVQEMNALTRVSQGVNITLTFDDVLELIYAQTAQIITLTHFHITLYNKPNDYYYYGFSVENGERMVERENIPFPPNAGLGTEVIRKSRPILTQDHLRECQARSLAPVLDGVYAWMGVPLNAGAESIGTLSISSSDPGTSYTRGQLDLLHAIADQTAGAIVKARLLQETQQRAHQLASLNDVTRQLTSTLELEPLLQNILDSAVAILNCEAGSLFLVDEQTDELIFKVTVGPVAKDLLGQRLPPGSGIVGKAVQLRAPVVENNAQRTGGRFSGTDKQTGFLTRALLAVPLQIKERVLGVVEVINRRDGLPFVEDDQNLLTAFAGQAAVAIENARLYTLTDQELADRVEELSVMQRIDRELNASLEMGRAMRITLEWAMRQSRAEAGLIGVVEEGHLVIMAGDGYDEFLANLPNRAIKIELPSMQAAMETGQPQRVSFPPNSNSGLLPAAITQIVIPIRRETTVIGLLMLESAAETQADVAFLTRLSDHAAIAISNAQLFSEVQRANEAKSDFVSFVAHELKNPMTSIKGFTELLAAGAAGQISDAQINFLKTIRSNVERMSTLVSDLNDNSKIEANKLRLEFKAANVPDLIDEVVRSTKRQIEDKKQEIAVDVREGLPPIWADRIRVSQVLVNLVSNAHKYTPEGGKIMVGAEESDNVWDAESAAKKVVHIWVKDNGIGINVEDQKKIFQKFFRSDDSKARESPGTGLGLNITRSLIEMQGGRIWFDSEFRQGTTFHITVPVAEG
jgi:signal transduction histidine kinase